MEPLKIVEVKVNIPIYSEDTDLEQILETLKKEPMYFIKDDEFGVAFGGIFHNYDFGVADLLREMSTEEIENLKKVSKISALKRELAKLESEI